MASDCYENEHACNSRNCGVSRNLKMHSVTTLLLSALGLVAAAPGPSSLGGFGIGGVPGVTPHDKMKAGISNGQFNEWRDRMRKW